MSKIRHPILAFAILLSGLSVMPAALANRSQRFDWQRFAAVYKTEAPTSTADQPTRTPTITHTPTLQRGTLPPITPPPTTPPPPTPTFTRTPTAMPADKPDLVVASDGWPSTASKDQLVGLTYTVTNRGDARAYTGTNGGFWTGLFVDGQRLTHQDDPALLPGQSHSDSFRWKATCGTHVLQLEVDLWNYVAESDEGNNRTVAHTLGVPCDTITPTQSAPDDE